MCSTLGLHKKVHSFFFGVVRLGGVWRGGGEMVHVSGGRGFAWGFRGGRGDPSVIMCNTEKTRKNKYYGTNKP